MTDTYNQILDARSAILMGWEYVPNINANLDYWNLSDKEKMWCNEWSPTTKREDLTVFIQHVCENELADDFVEIDRFETMLVALWDEDDNPNHLGYGAWLLTCNPAVIVNAICNFFGE